MLFYLYIFTCDNVLNFSEYKNITKCLFLKLCISTCIDELVKPKKPFEIHAKCILCSCLNTLS